MSLATALTIAMFLLRRLNICAHEATPYMVTGCQRRSALGILRKPRQRDILVPFVLANASQALSSSDASLAEPKVYLQGTNTAMLDRRP